MDIVAHDNIGSNVQLSKNERRAIAHVLHNACMMDGAKVNVMSAIDMMVESLKRIILDKSNEKLMLPVILPNNIYMVTGDVDYQEKQLKQTVI